MWPSRLYGDGNSRRDIDDRIMSDLFVDNIKHQSSQGSGTITIGASGETIQAASGAQNNIGIGGCQMFVLNTPYNIVAADTAELLTTWTDATDASGVPSSGKIGSLISHSSGTFSFSETGVYKINFHCYGYLINDSSRYVGGLIYSTTDNSTYSQRATGYFSVANIGGTTSATGDATLVLDVTDTTNVKARMYAMSNDADTVIYGENTRAETCVTFTRLGDT